MRTRTVLLAALVAAIAGGVAGVLVNRPMLVANNELAQQALQAVVAQGAPPLPAGVTVARKGEPLPAIPVRTLDGATVDLRAAIAGKPTLVNVWATWCAPCMKEMPDLQAFADAQGAGGVQVVGVALDDAQAVTQFVRDHRIAYRQWIDTPSPADAGVRLGNPRGVLPFTVLVDAAGVVQRMRIGPFDSADSIADWARTH